MNSWVVITTINPPRKRLFEFLNFGWKIVIIGDAKTSEIEWEEINNQSLHYLSLATQEKIFPELSKLIGANTYARKNIGYLYAASQGADRIFDTDDDTFPREGFYDFVENSPNSRRINVEGEGFFNPYLEFAPNSGLWPRGYPLDLISKDRWNQNPNLQLENSDNSTELEVIQTLVNLEPDLDAIYRMTVSDEILDFPIEKVIYEIKNPVFSPGNTQSTLWLNKEKFEYLYIPITVSFRFCDIFKMYVAQRFCSFAYAGFWTDQTRNPHVYMRDFESEIECFLNVRGLTETLKEIQTSRLRNVYKSLLASKLCKSVDLECSTMFSDLMEEYRR